MSEHLVVADVKGSVVTVTDPLQRDYVEGTQVRKVTQFELFESKNWQEHILYLAHDKYFAVKSEAQFTLLVEHAPGVIAEALVQRFEAARKAVISAHFENAGAGGGIRGMAVLVQGERQQGTRENEEKTGKHLS